MKYRYSVLILFVLVTQLLFGQNEKVLEGVIRVKLKPEIVTSAKGLEIKSVKGQLKTGVESIDKLNSIYAANTMKRVFPYSSKFEERHIKHGLHLWYEISYSGKASVQDIVKAYSQVAEIERAEAIHTPTLIDGEGEPHYLPSTSLNSSSTVTMPFNDPSLQRQWHYNNTGQTGGTPGADINLFNAWQISTGKPNVIVSIHDQGVQYDHPDLKNMMWVNQTELSGTTGVDDDNNGYIDDIYGVNFSDNTGYVNVDYHGTHVAGTVAAENNNGIGVSGVAGGSGNNDGVRIMTCQILGGSLPGDIPNSYVYAADMGAVISQNSWGYQSEGYYDQATHDGIDYFIAEAGNYAGSPMKGGIVIFASGNNDTEGLMYPGAYSSVIAVNSLGSKSTKAVYSNYGTWTEISGPGGNSYDDLAFGTTSNYSNGVLSTLNKSSYGYLDGTSMACPHVSGIAALVVSKYGGPNFTNKDLEKHLLTGYREIYQFDENKPYLGKLGIGYADAVLALAADNGIAPEKITNLELTGISQDFATLKWSVPSDQDDVKPKSFEILYSKQEITLANLQYAKILVQNNSDTVGAQKIFTVNGLQPLTNYYFAVRSTDRWGNISNFSNVVVGKTNSGPTASLDPLKPELNITIDVTKNTIGEDSVKIFNSGEGVLRWDALTRLIEAIPYSTKPDFKYPSLLNPSSMPSGVLGFEVPVVMNNIQHDTLVEGTYINESGGLRIFGETNLEIPNSSATRFYIGKSEGFNLTRVDPYMKIDSTFGPVIVEVYVGYDISNAKLVHAQEFKIHGERWFTLNLNQQLFFKQGTYFWIAVHAPVGNSYPLGGGLELKETYSKNCYMSLNGGKTWKLFEELFLDSRVVWALYAVSSKVRLSEYISLQPDSGIVTTNQFETIKASVDASNLINGIYSNNLVFNINESGKPMLTIPLKVNITGHLPKISSQRRVDFGGVIIGNSKEVTVKFENSGLGRFAFKTPYFTFSDTQFEYAKGLSSNIEALTSQELTFKFTPQKAGNNYCDVTLIDANGNNYTFELFGAGLEPPIIKINPENVSYSNLNLGDSIQNSFFISNIGKYPLDYFIPAFANGSNMVVTPTNVPKFGYTWKQDITGVDFVWNDISTTGTDITKEFGSHDFYFKLPLNFLFPFYGKNENELFITSYGVITFTDQGALNSLSPNMFKYEYFPSRYISGCGFSMKMEDAGFGKIYYKQGTDKLIVQYEHVPVNRGVGYDSNGNVTQTYITFQMVLFDNGDIKMYYKDSNLAQYENSTLIAMEDKGQNDGLLILGGIVLSLNHYSPRYGDFGFQPQSTIQIFNPGMGLFSNVTNPYGTIKPGDSTKVEYKIKTDSLFLLPYKEKLVIVSNDPKNNPTIHTVNFNITSGGVSNLVADTSSFDFGKVFKTDVKTNTFHIYNAGTAIDSIISASFDNGYFTISGNIPEILKPERRLPYVVSLITSTIGVYSDTLRIVSKNGQILKLGLTAEVIQDPIMTLKTSTGSILTSITKILPSGNAASQSFKIENTGGVDLKVAPVRNGFTQIREVTPSANVDNNTYAWKSSKDFGGPNFDWVEIVENGGTRITGLHGYKGPQFTSGIKMPFTFNFYGKDYDTLYIGVSGILTFTKNQEDYKYYFGYGVIPSVGQPDNFIAPLFAGFGAPGFVGLYPLADPYYKIESDRIIIEYKDYNSTFMLENAISYEVILYPSGVIKFQYLIAPENTNNGLTPYGVVGVENIDGTQGVEVTNRSRYINSSMAIELYPVRTYSIAPTETKDFVIDFSAKDLIAGTYQDSLKFSSNDPLAKNKKLPVKLIVTGTPAISKPDTISFGDNFINPKVTKITKEFEVKNIGTDYFTINSASNTLTSEIKIEAYVIKNETWQWIDIYATNFTMFPRTVLAHSSLKLRVTITPTTPDILNDELVLSTNLSVAQQKIRILAGIYNPPIIGYSQDTISYYAQAASFTKTHKIGLNNLGAYNLNYNLRLDYQRATTESSNPAGATTVQYAAPNLLPFIKLFDKSIKVNAKTSKSTTFNQVLVHDTATVSASNLGYGGKFPFHTATGFYAPSKGFNLTHVQTWYTPSELLNSVIEVRIYSGAENISDCRLLYAESFAHNITANDIVGKLLTFKLSQNIEFFPNEKFFIEFAYQIEAYYPQGCVQINNSVENRYMFGAGDGWYDLSTYNDYSETGFMTRAVEESSSSTPWVILSSNDAGNIAPSTTDSIQVDFDAHNAVNGDNFAYLTINSNDLVKPKSKITLHLRKNQGPVFSNIEKLTVVENSTIDFSITATDIEGDDFNVTLDGNYPFVTVISTTKKSGEKSFGFTQLVKTLNLKYSPNYTCQGDQNIKFKSTDTFGNIETTTVSVNVKNVNRPPVAIPMGIVKINPKDLKFISIYDLFSDPDMDIKTVTAVVDNSNILTLFNSEKQFMLMPLIEGNAHITFVATDEYGAVATNVVQVSISNLYTDIDSPDSMDEIKAYPNPTVGLLNLNIPESVAGSTSVTVYNSLGVLIKSELVKGSGASNTSIDLSNLQPGLYLVVVKNDTMVKTLKIFKQ